MSGLLRALLSLALLVALLAWMEPGAWLPALRVLDPAVLLAAFALTAIQVGLATARWRIVARRLGQRLPLELAARETYLATLLNQVLPGGVAGDAARAWRLRHGPGLHRSAGGVALERAVGQAVLVAACVVALLLQPALWQRLGAGGLLHGIAITAALAGLLATLAWRWRRALRLREGLVLVRERLLSRPGILLALAAVSLLLLVAYLAVFVLAARAMGVSTALPTLLPLMLVSLLAMSIPLGFGGLGLREGAAALAWAAAGLPAAEGAAAALGYGLLVLLCSLPAALVLAWPHPRASGAGSSPGSSSSNRVS